MSRWEVKVQRKRFIDSYNNLKDRYTDLLDSLDINRILNNDKEFNADLQFIDNKLDNYSKMWLVFLVILLSITLFLFLFYNSSQLFNSPFWKLISQRNLFPLCCLNILAFSAILINYSFKKVN